MRSNISFCLLLAVVVGCSKQPAGTNPQLPKQSSRVAPSAAALGRPAELTIVETTEDKERAEIRAKSFALLTAHRYDELEVWPANIGRPKNVAPMASGN